MKTHVMNVEAANALQSATNQPGTVQSITTSHVPSGLQNMNGICSAFVSVYEASETYVENGVTISGEYLVAILG